MALYAAETWTLTKADKKRLEAFKVWMWRRMLKISWNEKVTNSSVLEKAKEERSLLNTIWQQNTHGWGMRFKLMSYCEKLLKEEWRAKHSEEERDYIC